MAQLPSKYDKCQFLYSTIVQLINKTNENCDNGVEILKKLKETSDCDEFTDMSWIRHRIDTHWYCQDLSKCKESEHKIKEAGFKIYDNGLLLVWEMNAGLNLHYRMINFIDYCNDKLHSKIEKKVSLI